MSRRVLQGVVVGDASNKTVIVRVERRVMHPLYKKFVTHSKKYAAHDENNSYRNGDLVRIEESRPISKRKCWVVISGPPDAAPGRRFATKPTAAVVADIDLPELEESKVADETVEPAEAIEPGEAVEPVEGAP